MSGAVINVYSFVGPGGGPIRGLVTARFRGDRRSVRVGASLHGLPVAAEDASREFLVAAVTKPCAQAVDAGDLVVWRTRIDAYPNPAADGFSWGVINGAAVPRPPGSARSVRVYDRDAAGQLSELDCASGEGTGRRR